MFPSRILDLIIQQIRKISEQLLVQFDIKICFYILQTNADFTETRQEVARMQKERERYEEMMKKAFMRGVCALNLEAMTIFHNNEEKENRDTGK